MEENGRLQIDDVGRSAKLQDGLGVTGDDDVPPLGDLGQGSSIGNQVSPGILVPDGGRVADLEHHPPGDSEVDWAVLYSEGKSATEVQGHNVRINVTTHICETSRTTDKRESFF